MCKSPSSAFLEDKAEKQACEQDRSEIQRFENRRTKECGESVFFGPDITRRRDVFESHRAVVGMGIEEAAEEEVAESDVVEEEEQRERERGC
jgi:hypothetical protein